MCASLAKHGLRILQERAEHRFVPQRWVLAYHLGSEAVPLHQFRFLAPPRPAQWADPFPISVGGEYYLFFEEQLSAGEPAHISVMQMGAHGDWGEPVVVLRAGHHLSYPHVFEWDGCLYMVPETLATRQVELYRCTEFPYTWELAAVLLENVRAVDPTLYEANGEWWMFLNSAADHAKNCEELHLYTAPAPTGPWVPHRDNPVKSDVRSTRPAGRVFNWHGRVLRPSQDSGGRYGRAIAVNEVLHLDHERFEERELGRVEPNWHPSVSRVHTFNAVAGLTVVDCLQSGLRARNHQ
jgi:hypothetical protein